MVHPIKLFLNLLNHNYRLLLESELLLKKDLPIGIHLSILAYPKLGKDTKRKVSSFPHKVPIESIKVFLDSVAAFKESQTFPSQLSLEIGEFSHPFSFFAKTHIGHLPCFHYQCNHFMSIIWKQIYSVFLIFQPIISHIHKIKAIHLKLIVPTLKFTNGSQDFYIPMYHGNSSIP